MKKSLMVALVVILLVAFAMTSVYGAPAKVKLTVWGMAITDNDPANVYTTKLVKGFKAKNPNIDLQYIPLGNDGLKNKTKVAMAGGSGLPDIFQTWGGSTMGSYADAGRLLDLTAELKSIPASAAAVDAMSWKGKTYGVAPFFAIAAVFYNTAIYTKLGLKVPTTMVDFEANCDKLLAGGYTPIAVGAKDKWPTLALYMYLVNRFGGDSFTQAAARKIAFNSEAFIKAGEKYQEWFKKGYFGTKPLGDDYGAAQSLMMTGKAGMQISGSWLCGGYSDPKQTKEKFALFSFPTIAGGKGAIGDFMGMPDIAWAATIAAKDKKDAAVAFLTYAISVEACSADPGRFASVPGVKAGSDLTKSAGDLFATAKTITFWWDQDLPAALGTPVNEAICKFFLPDADVTKAMTDFEALAVGAMGAVAK